MASPTNPFSSFGIYFLIIIAAFLALFIAAALLLYSCRCRVACGFLWQCLAYRAGRGWRPPEPEAIPVRRYREEQSFSSECSVCLTAFRNGEKVRQLPACRHSFHVPCVDTWLYSNSSCPSCRAPVPRAAAVCPRTEAMENTHSNQQQQQQQQQQQMMMIDSRGEADAIASIL